MAANDRPLGGLYAALTPEERSRLLARYWREDNITELDRLRWSIPDDAAGRAYNRAVASLRGLNRGLPLYAAATTNATRIDHWRLTWLATHEFDRWKARGWLHRVWRFIPYPVTEAEHRRIVALERDEPLPLDAYAEMLAEREGAEPGLRPEVAALLRDLPPNLVPLPLPDDHRIGDPVAPDLLAENGRCLEAITSRVRRLIDAAIERGELPAPTPTRDGPALPTGMLFDWGEGTSNETFAPLPPDYHVPALELVGGDFARWDTRPDGEAEAVRARRAELWRAFAAIVREAGHLQPEELDGLDLEPPATAVERERARAAVERAWPWDLKLLQRELGMLAAQHGRRRAELRAYEAVVEAVRREEFGGEDPLDPPVRGMLEGCAAADGEYEGMWTAVAEAAGVPAGAEGNEWPALEADAAYVAELQARLRNDLAEA